ncbi:MAG TPA: dihydroxyacetone kinase subunit DhaK, partial [Acidimicrobiales bacterium]
MNHFVNDPADAVTEALDGVVRGAGDGHLERLDGYPDIKVVARVGLPNANVAVVSGGGAGHEPAHAGFVGAGLLSAAVCGEIFASPSVEAVLAAILATAGDAGCLLIVKNYTGDRLNFGLAEQRAKALGVKVATVVVGDDIALPDADQRRGLAGTLLVHKVAGSWAERGASLEEVHAAAADVAGAIRTFSVSLSGADIPGRPSDERLGDDEAELGLGIHGEPGVETITVGPAAELVGRLVDRLGAAVPPGVPLALLINNLGGVSALEMSVILHDVLASDIGARAELVVGPAPLMTSLAMRGLSVTALPLDDARREALLTPVAPWTAWPGAPRPGPLRRRPLPARLRHSPPPPSADPRARRMVTVVCEALITEQRVLDALDAKVGDGDTGSTVAAAARRVLGELDELPLGE